MSQSPLSNLSKEEYAARHRLLRLILGLLGVLVIVLLIVQFRAALIGTATVIGTTAEQGQELVSDLTGDDDTIGTFGDDVQQISDEAKGGFITILLQEAVLNRVADKVENPPEVPVEEPAEEASEDGAASAESAELPEGETPAEVIEEIVEEPVVTETE